MPAYDKETVALECPGCKREMEATYYDVYSRREAKCRRALEEKERAEKKLEEAINNICDKADIQIKK